MDAGFYSSRLRRCTFTDTLNSETGEKVRTHTPANYLWCGIEETGGAATGDYGGKQSGAVVTIRVRGYPALSVKDILRYEYYETDYHIESIYEGDRELVCDCYRYDTLNDITE